MHMTSIPKTKVLPFKYLMLVSLIIPLLVIACQTPAPRKASTETKPIWEAWDHVKKAYIGSATLDSQQVTGTMIQEMLDAAEKPAYPFLTRLKSVRSQPPRDVPKEMIDVWKAWTLLKKKWPNVDSKVLSEAAIRGMLKVLEDESTVYLPPEDYIQAKENLSGTYGGIGAGVSKRGDNILVTSTMKGSPAERAGLMEGDIILQVDGEPVDGKTVQQVIGQVRGLAGTKVNLLIQRPGVSQPLEFSIVRGIIDLQSVDARLFPGAIGYIFISEFLDNTDEAVVDRLENLKKGNINILALILDLRSNPGGSVEAARNVVSQFLPGGLFMYELDVKGQRKDWTVEKGGLATTEKLPMVVLVNQFTEREAEAVAGALQDAQRAKVVGVKTRGKGTSNVFMRLSNGSAIYIPVSRWYTPAGRLIEAVGIEPDIQVSLTSADLAARRDAQLIEAYNYLDKLLPPFR